MPFGVITLTTVETGGTGPSGETIDTSRHRALGSTSRVAILRLVRAATNGLTAADVAERTGLHFSTARAHLERLTKAGLLVRARSSGGLPGRPAWRYRGAAPDPAPAPYRSLAGALLDSLSETGGDTRAGAARVGRVWGQQLANASGTKAEPVETVIRVLDGLGFAPRRMPKAPAEGTTELHLQVCPFLELVAKNPDAMCGLHLGVIRGALEQCGASSSDVVLEPFGAPAACVVHMSTQNRQRGGGQQ